MKDLKSELRTRYALNALIMFVVVTISMLLFATAGEVLSAELLSGLLWVVIFFSAMSGLSRTFVSEEDRGTVIFLQLSARPSVVYFGKLLFNLVLIFGINFFVVVAYLLTMENFKVRSFDVFLVALILGGMGLASTSTIIAAIIAKANTKGTLYPVLSFPILLPLLITAINMTQLSIEGASLAETTGHLRILFSYFFVVIIASYLLFDYIWKE
ncbi:MAG: heme exporter protein CcmB [Candidatus Kryptonium sp.]|nr:heme exporter protein CcmB [Candidatus Kryptonium sp.]